MGDLDEAAADVVDGLAQGPGAAVLHGVQNNSCAAASRTSASSFAPNECRAPASPRSACASPGRSPVSRAARSATCMTSCQSWKRPLHCSDGCRFRARCQGTRPEPVSAASRTASSSVSWWSENQHIASS
ncbi:hypothetical protein J2S43_004853 [Catenuloplanes nepalensis]|uniref:Uncharacterized protein n=1 Tax=Catenuloplanes nepalensis TaxID=587533 RepID=A0ABT9MZ82_9ACTN|nr:hypothetical protein [Catenuloplanes nepalensis]MDP9796341.1 hypothetical protein [Catenuloplanes nepalensis]